MIISAVLPSRPQAAKAWPRSVPNSAKAAARVQEIADADCVHMGGGLFRVTGKSDTYWVDLNSPRPYPICSCKNYHLSNPTEARQSRRVIACKHILKIQDMRQRGVVTEPPMADE